MADHDRLIDLLGRGPLPEAPPPLVRRAVELWTQPMAAIEGVLAELVMDSHDPALAHAGVRGAGARRLRFEGGGLELDLSIEAAGPKQQVRGQLTSLSPSGISVAQARIEVLTRRSEAWRGHADAQGEFRLECAEVPHTIRAQCTDEWVNFEVPR